MQINETRTIKIYRGCINKCRSETLIKAVITARARFLESGGSLSRFVISIRKLKFKLSVIRVYAHRQ